MSNYVTDGGYGFIHTLNENGSGMDVFFHISDVPGGNVEEGWRFKFDMENTEEGLRAKNIEIISKNKQMDSQKEYDRIMPSDSEEESTDVKKKDWLAERMKDREDNTEDDEKESSPFSTRVKGSKNDILTE